LLCGTAAACGSESGSPAAAPSAAGSSAAAAESSAFPMTIENKFGSTTIASEPKRIVTVGLTDQDAVLALGKVPVGTTDWLGGYKGAIGPWATGKLGTAAVPTMLTDTGVATPYEGFFVYGSQDSRSRTLTSLGFTLPADLDTVIDDKFGAGISKERSDLLDQKAIVWTVPDVAKDPATLHEDKLYKDLNVVKQSREVFIGESTDYGKAFSFVTVLSLPYVIERLVPQLAAAVDGDVATKVEEPTS
jgi:ABC-type Fe3+-hydroxamate transport system substrate-binding protein